MTRCQQHMPRCCQLFCTWIASFAPVDVLSEQWPLRDGLLLRRRCSVEGVGGWFVGIRALDVTVPATSGTVLRGIMLLVRYKLLQVVVSSAV